MDVIEARTDQTLDLHIQWSLKNWTEDEREIFKRVTIQEVGKEENKSDIWIMRGETTIGTLAKNTFYVWSEQDVNFIDWSMGLFRYI